MPSSPSLQPSRSTTPILFVALVLATSSMIACDDSGPATAPPPSTDSTKPPTRRSPGATPAGYLSPAQVPAAKVRSIAQAPAAVATKDPSLLTATEPENVATTTTVISTPSSAPQAE